MKKILLLSIFLLSTSFIFSQNLKLDGLYKCSEEDLIALYANGTGRLSISYLYDGIISFRWKYDHDKKNVNLEFVLTDEQKYLILNRYLTLPYSERSGRQILSHYTSGPTFVYVKQ